MTREETIKGLEICTKNESFAECVSKECPFIGGSIDGNCIEMLMHNALALLKAQEQNCRECGEATSKAIQELQAKLKAQEPVEPIPTEDDDWICGACNNSVVGTEELDEGGFVPIRFNYCPNCGREVRWT